MGHLERPAEGLPYNMTQSIFGKVRITSPNYKHGQSSKTTPQRDQG